MSLTLKTALDLVNAGLQAGLENDVRIAIVVIDRGGRILASARDEQASYLSLEIAARKAVTANMFGKPTLGIMEMIKGDLVLLHSATSDAAQSIIPGGMPIMVGGKILGAFGVSGGHYLKDHTIAELALKAAGIG